MKLETNRVYTIDCMANECSDEAIDRFMAENGYKKRVWVKVAGSCERVYYRKNGTDWWVSFKCYTLNDDMSGKVEFELAK